MTETVKRFAFAIVAAPVFLAVTYVGGWLFGVMMVAIMILIQREMISMMSMQGFRPNPYLTYAFGLAIVSFSIWDQAVPALLVMLLAFITVETLNKEHRNLYRMMSTLYCSMYAPVAVLTMIAMRLGQSEYSGFFLFMVMCLMIWGNDSLAYYGGRLFGKHLMAPHMSPKKTWEGFAAGFLGAGLAFALAFVLSNLLGVMDPKFAAPFTWQQAWPMIILASVFGPIGDLAESKVKRAAGAKDSSNLLPGHGGFWDRFDSMLLVAPALYLYILLMHLW